MKTDPVDCIYKLEMFLTSIGELASTEHAGDDARKAAYFLSQEGVKEARLAREEVLRALRDLDDDGARSVPVCRGGGQ